MATFFQQYTPLLICGLGAAVILLFIFCIVLLLKINREKKRYDLFTGSKRRPPHNLETKIQECYDYTKSIEEKYSKLLDMMTDIDKTNKQQIRKVGLVRYNPFEEMGGNLCFALALLDGEDNGVVLNGIHSRTGSFTYAKPIEMGVSTYMLSEEEKQAVKMAQDNAYEPQHEKVVKVRFKPIFKRRYAAAMDQQMMLMEVAAAKQKKASLGDVTTEEKEQIQQEEAIAGRIASAETEKLQEDLQSELQMELHTEDLEKSSFQEEDALEKTKIQPKGRKLWRNKKAEEIEDREETSIKAEQPAPKKQKKTLQEKVQEELQKADMEETSIHAEQPAPKKQKKTLQEKVQEELQKADMEETSIKAEQPVPKKQKKTLQEKVQEELQKADMEETSIKAEQPAPKKQKKTLQEKVQEELRKEEALLQKMNVQKETAEDIQAIQKDLQAELQSLLSTDDTAGKK